MDDSPVQGELCRCALASVYDVEVFTDGARMLEELSSRIPPELLILDWHMPNLSGLEVCRFVRETRDAGALPILFLTASGDESLTQAFDAGANDFVRKPFSEAELRARVGALVRTRQIHARLNEVETQLRVEAEFREGFIGMLAHDLRQPLNTFNLANQSLSTLLNPEPRLQSLFGMQDRATRRMTRMISELLDFARSRPEGGMPVDRREMDLGNAARSVVEEMQIGHPSHTLRLNVIGDCVGIWDRDRLSQICSNLIGNAIEHSSSPSSPIDVTVFRDGERVALTVSNAGEPIGPDVLPSLFEPFRRGKGAGRANGGVGLGLHIVKRIAQAHGGSVAARSDANATTFTVTLPVE
ncbi:MAG TPA: HAMP domain-containing sensor histidine kinase [Polyangiaceae bacterium]|nr:HAMP domain-containing sensor histidine kinase [Polyangiaceae bacterium]